jgi:4-hydroxy-3-polyprenylbenzoate decarboxylase
LLEGLVDAGCEVGVTASSSGVEVLGTELWGEPGIGRKDALTRLVGEAVGVTAYDPDDYGSPYASGSARVDGYVVCPCSMATVGTIAAGAMANLVHRAASVALKEGRKLVLVPRETPLSTIHLENLLRLRHAGAVILFAAPGFYHAPRTIDDLINFVVGRCLDQLGIAHDLTRRWGE